MVSDGVCVPVIRSPEIEKFRSSLPAVLTEQEVVDAVRNNDFSMVCGGTGCGKSTQVPQFLYEAGFTEGKYSGRLIGVTQPRRVAAVSVSQRVGEELNNPKLVGYQVRYDKRISSADMRIKFMTDGILLREVQEDIRLLRYSVIVIDEAHERSINCDMLLGLLSGSIRARRAMNDPLKVVVMSATLKLTDFTSNKYLFPNMAVASSCNSSAIVHIDSKLYPVTVHYERRTSDDYVELVKAKIHKVHTTLPPGSILVFVTGKREVWDICEYFKNGGVDDQEDSDSNSVVSEEDSEVNDIKDAAVCVSSSAKRLRHSSDNPDQIEEDFNLGETNTSFVEQLTFDSDRSSNQKISSNSSSGAQQFTGGDSSSSLRIYPLHAQMTSEKQLEVFNASQQYPNDRIVVVSTNVAETSLTIPNVRYVIDCGREKRREFNASGVSRFAVRFASQASANQRAGRCGRVGPGHVYRLYSPNVFGEHMSEFPAPEIETNPLDSAILFLKALGVPDVLAFPWPTRPPESHVQAALKRLEAIACVDRKGITERGRQVSLFPVSPRLAVVFVLLGEHNSESKDSKFSQAELMTVACAVVACLGSDTGVSEISPSVQKSREIAMTAFDDDLEMILTWFAKWYLLGASERIEFCKQLGLSAKGMEEASALFHSLLKGKISEDVDAKKIFSNIAKNNKALKTVRKLLLHGFVDQIALRDQVGENAYRAPANSQPVFIHRTSAMYRRRPQWVCFTEMVQASGEFSDKRTMRTCIEVDPEYFASQIVSPLIDRSKLHPVMRPTKIGAKKYVYVVPRYVPLSVSIVDCLPIEDK